MFVLILTELLKQKYYKTLFTNHLLAFFINMKLSDAKIDEIPINMQTPEHIDMLSNLSAESVFMILRGSVYHNLFSLFKMFANLYLDQHNPLTYFIQERRWAILLADAAKHSNSDLLCQCVWFVENVTKKSLWQLEYTMWAGTYLTPLHAALQRGDYTVFLKLFASYKKYKPSMISELTLLLHCCTVHSIDNNTNVIDSKIRMISDILHFKCDAINETDAWFKRTPLIMDRVHFKIAMHLLDKNADATAKDGNWSHTVAHRAAMYYTWKEFCLLVEKLLQNGYVKVLGMRNKMSLTPLAVALQKININPTEFINSPAYSLSFSYLEQDVDSLLYSAVVGLQSVIILKKLVRQGANTLVTWDDGKTYVHVAADYGHVEAIKYFTSQRCSVNARDKNGFTPFHSVLIHCTQNTDLVLTTLIKLSADITAIDNEGQSMIFYADAALRDGRIDCETHKIFIKHYEAAQNANRQSHRCTAL